MKVGFYNYIHLGTLGEFEEELSDQVKQQGSEIIFNDIADLVETYKQYDLLILHLETEPHEAEKIIPTIEKPILFINGTKAKIDYVREYHGEKSNYTYQHMMIPEVILEFIQKNS